MKDILDEVIEEEHSLKLKEIVVGVVLKPRSTFEKIHKSSVTKYAILVLGV